MISVSLCVIVKNEEEVLAGCLDSVKDIADEIKGEAETFFGQNDLFQEICLSFY
jgi:glycosyltransferase involved in cell wall biosynthesis